MEYEKRIAEAFTTPAPTEALRNFALELGRAGHSRREIYRIFHDYDCHLQDTGRDAESTIMFDVLDMISGNYAPNNLDLPDESR